MEHQWKPFSLTHITYPAHSPVIAPLLALLSLTPPFGVCALATAALVYKDVLAAYLLAGSVSSAVVTSIIKKAVRQPRPMRYDDEVGDGYEGMVVGTTEGDYGMPSNHSCYVWFCAVFIVLYTLRGGGGGLRIGQEEEEASSSTVAQLATSSSQSHSNTCINGNGNGYASASTTTTTTTCIISTNTWHNLHTSITVILSLLIAVGCSYSRIYLGYHTAMQAYVGSAVGVLLGCIWYGLLETDRVRRSLISLDATLRELERGRMQLRLGGLNSNGMKND